MAYSESLAVRVRAQLAGTRGVVEKNITEKRMFGGLAFLLRGNLLVGVWKYSLLVRLGPEQGSAALNEPHVRPFDITGKPMKGWVLVDPDGIDDDAQLSSWIERARDFVATLPSK